MTNGWTMTNETKVPLLSTLDKFIMQRLEEIYLLKKYRSGEIRFRKRKGNLFTLSGYPIMSSTAKVVKDDVDADEWYKNHW